MERAIGWLTSNDWKAKREALGQVQSSRYLRACAEFTRVLDKFQGKNEDEILTLLKAAAQCEIQRPIEEDELAQWQQNTRALQQALSLGTPEGRRLATSWLSGELAILAQYPRDPKATRQAHACARAIAILYPSRELVINEAPSKAEYYNYKIINQQKISKIIPSYSIR